MASFAFSQGRRTFLQIAGASFLALAAIHFVMLSDGILSARPEPPARTVALMPREAQAIEPAAGPQAGGGAGEEPSLALSRERMPPDDLRFWGADADLVCDPHLLRAIQERRRQLDARAAELVERSRMLEVVEKRASELLRALQETQIALEENLAAADRVAGAGVMRLVAIYESMKPKDAARVFDAMPPEIAAGFIRRMREAKAALIMAHLDANHAYAITLSLANRGSALREE